MTLKLNSKTPNATLNGAINKEGHMKKPQNPSSHLHSTLFRPTLLRQTLVYPLLMGLASNAAFAGKDDLNPNVKPLMQGVQIQQGLTPPPPIPVRHGRFHHQEPNLLLSQSLNVAPALQLSSGVATVSAQPLAPYHNPSEVEEVRKADGKSYLYIGGDTDQRNTGAGNTYESNTNADGAYTGHAQEAQFSALDLQIAAGEVVYRKEHNLPLPEYSRTSIDLFKKIANGEVGKKANRTTNYERTLVLGSDAVKRLQVLLNDTQQLRNDMTELSDSIHHPWWTAIARTIAPSKTIKSEKDFNADVFSSFLYQKAPHKRLSALRNNLDKIPPLTHPEYLRILWAFERPQQWEAHQILSALVFTHLRHFPAQLLVDWAPRIELEVLNDNLRKKGRYSRYSLDGAEAVYLIQIAAQTPTSIPVSDKPLLGLRDQLRKATSNDWLATDLLHMEVAPKVAFLAKVLAMTQSVDLSEFAAIEKYARVTLDTTQMQNIEKNPSKPKKKSPANRNIDTSQISSLISDEIERLHQPLAQNNLIDLSGLN